MGDNFLKRQAENFKKGRDLAIDDLSQPTLWNRPEFVQTIFTAVPGKECQLRSGEVLTVYASEDGNTATLARGHRSVGHIGEDGAKLLLGALSEKGSGGIAQVQVTEVSGLSGFGKAVIVED